MGSCGLDVVIDRLKCFGSEILTKEGPESKVDSKHERLEFLVPEPWELFRSGPNSVDMIVEVFGCELA